MVGVLKLVGEHVHFRPGLAKYAEETTVVMGQKLLDPPTVEGWHTGKEWIDGGNLTERVNFAVGEVGKDNSPGIKRVVNRIIESDALGTAESFVNSTLDAIGPIDVEKSTRQALLKFASESDNDDDRSRIVRMLQLIVSTPDYQYA